MSMRIVLFLLFRCCLSISPVEVLRRLQDSPVEETGASPEEQAWINRAHQFESLKASGQRKVNQSPRGLGETNVPDLVSTAWLLLRMLPNKQKTPAGSRPVYQQNPHYQQTEEYQQTQTTQQDYQQTYIEEELDYNDVPYNATHKNKPGISDMEDAKFLKASTVSVEQPRHHYTYRLISAPKVRYQEQYQEISQEPPHTHIRQQHPVPPPSRAPSQHLVDSTPQLPAAPSYTCLATGRNFCTLEEDSPSDLMEELESFSSLLANFTTKVPSVEASGPLFSELPLESAPCLTEIGAVQPGWFRDEQTSKWLFALQTQTFQQWIRIEDCRTLGASCQYVMPYYRSYCQSRLALHQVMAWDPEKRQRLAFGYLKTPGGCECHVTI